MTAIVLGFFAVDTLRNEPATFVAIVAVGLLAIVLDFLWKRGRPADRHPLNPEARPRGRTDVPAAPSA